MNILVQLFLSFFQIGLFSIGGGYAAMPLIQSQVVEIHQWLTMTQFADIITIAEMTPGPIAINSAVFVGTHIAGLPGAIIATIGCVAPSCIIVLTLAYIYTKYKNLSLMKGILSGLRPVVIALIASAGLSICKLAFFKEGAAGFGLEFLDPQNLIFFAAAFFILRKWEPSPIKVMVGVGVISALLSFI